MEYFYINYIFIILLINIFIKVRSTKLSIYSTGGTCFSWRFQRKKETVYQ